MDAKAHGQASSDSCQVRWYVLLIVFTSNRFFESSFEWDVRTWTAVVSLF